MDTTSGCVNGLGCDLGGTFINFAAPAQGLLSTNFSAIAHSHALAILMSLSRWM
jgi:hypothetical protein